MHTPRISVIMPCYNLGQYLDEAVESVLRQSYQEFEILIVDDGSTDDGTRRLLAQYERPRTRVVRSDNRGLPAAKNLGLTQTSGTYVCMLDPDDRIDRCLFEKSARVLDDDPSVAFVSHWARAFGEETWDWTPLRCDFPALLDTNTVNGSAVVRRAAIDSVGGFDESMRSGCEDWDLWISLVERGHTGVILPEVLFHYRRRPDSMSRVMVAGDGFPALYQRLIEKHAATFREHVDSLVLRRELNLLHLRRHIRNLEVEQSHWLTPQLTMRRDDVRRLQERADDLERRHERDRLIADNARQASALEIAIERAYELDAAAHHARSVLNDVLTSKSWRVSAPVRSLWGWLRGERGPHA